MSIKETRDLATAVSVCECTHMCTQCANVRAVYPGFVLLPLVGCAFTMGEEMGSKANGINAFTKSGPWFTKEKDSKSYDYFKAYVHDFLGTTKNSKRENICVKLTLLVSSKHIRVILCKFCRLVLFY